MSLTEVFPEFFVASSLRRSKSIAGARALTSVEFETRK